MKIARHRRASTLAIVDATLSRRLQAVRAHALLLVATRRRSCARTPGLLSILQALAYGVYARDTRAVRRPHPRVPPEVAWSHGRAGSTRRHHRLPVRSRRCPHGHGRGRTRRRGSRRSRTARATVRRARRLRPLRRRQAARGRDPGLPGLARRASVRATRSRGSATRKNDLVLQLIRDEGVEATRARAATSKRRATRACAARVVSSATTRPRCCEVTGHGPLTSRSASTATSSDELGLRGKPAPDTFLEGARRLGVAPEQAAVFEDALAGRRRRAAPGSSATSSASTASASAKRCCEHGADIVVDDLAELL